MSTKKFTVPVLRISYQFHDIEVEASTQDEANNAALDQAGNHLFEEKNVEYVLADAPSRSDVIGQAAMELVKVLERAGLDGECHEEIAAIREAMRS